MSSQAPETPKNTRRLISKSARKDLSQSRVSFKQGWLVYDIFHYKGETFDECLQIFDETFGRLSAMGMQINLNKSHSMAVQVELLGFILTRTGAKPTPTRIEAIIKLTPPQNVRSCRRIIGIVNFIKNHILTYARVTNAAPYGAHAKGRQVQVGQTQAEGVRQAQGCSSQLYSYHVPGPYKALYIYITRTRHRNTSAAAAGCCAKNKMA